MGDATLQIEVKAVATGAPPPAATFVPLFHRIIRERALPGLLIDVADYQHVHHGPAVLLVGHEGDYAWDLRDGTPGLLFRRRRGAEGDEVEQIREAVRRLWLACDIASADAEVAARFDSSMLELRIVDRLRAPTLAGFQETLDSVFGGSATIACEPFGEPGAPFGVRCRASRALRG
jgi:hypothetical protein